MGKIITLEQAQTLYDDLRRRAEYSQSALNLFDTATASGDIVSFSNGADDIPVKSLIAQITPVQDLHGQSAPYPAGGGKNKFDVDSGTLTNATMTKSGNGFTLTATNVNYPRINYDITSIANEVLYFTGSASGADLTGLRVVVSCYTGATITNSIIVLDSSNTSRANYSLGDLSAYDKVEFAVFEQYGGSATVGRSVTFNEFMFTATEVAEYAPYSNICPISGWTGAKITRTGKNLLNPATKTSGKYIAADGTIGNEASFSYSALIPVNVGESYTLSGAYSGGNITTRLHTYDAAGNWIANIGSNTSGGDVSITITIPSGVKYVRVSCSNNIANQQFEKGSTATTYEAYNGNTINVDWTDEAGTVYGGTLNVTTGVLTVTHRKTYETALFGSKPNYYGTVSVAADKSHPLDIICDKMKTASSVGADGIYINTSNGAIMFHTSDYDTASDLMDAFGGTVDFSYRLATPITYQLTPTEVKTLLGYNAIWADCGSIEVEYRTDVDDVPTEDSEGLVKSGGVYSAIKDVQDDVDAVEEDVADLQAEVDAIPDSVLPGATVGAADNLISDAKINSNSPYLYRPVINGVGNRAYSKLIGATIANNQLVQNGNFADASGWTGRYCSVAVSGNVATLTVTSAGASRGIYADAAVGFQTTSGHKYLFACGIKPPITSTLLFSISGGADNASVAITANVWNDAAGIINATQSLAQGRFYALVAGTTQVDDTIQYRNAQAYDLTAMFGSTIADYAYTLETGEAGSGIAWLKSYGFFSKYAPYNAGSLISTKAEKKKVVGFNQWDEQWDVGSISGTGEAVAGNYIRSKNYIPVIEGATYHFTKPNTTNNYRWIYAYDANKNFLPSVWGGANPYFVLSDGSNFTVPNGVAYIRFLIDSAYGQVYKNDICINISKATGTPKNGDYVAYASQEYDLGSDELRGLFKLDNGNLYADGDIKTSDGNITRKYGIVDLGTLNWAYFSGANARFRAIPSAAAKSTGNSNYPNVICPNYSTATYTQIYEASVDDVVGIGGDNNIYIRDTSYTDAATFKTAMSGVYLVYELATPTTEQGTPYIDPSIVYPNGTEEYIDTRTVPVPVGNETEYTEDLKLKLEELPVIPAAPETDGAYVLKATVADGVPVYTWEASE